MLNSENNVSLAPYLWPHIWPIAIPLSFVATWLAIVIYVLVAALWFIPDRRIEKHPRAAA